MRISLNLMRHLNKFLAKTAKWGIKHGYCEK